MEPKRIKSVFCAGEQNDTKHVATMDGNGEVVLTCMECGRSLKFAVTNAGDFQKLLDQHKKDNVGQLTQETLDKRLDEVLGE